nr:glycosyl transferase [Nitrosopumilaceae archaeon]NIU86615.1 glycosyl transferase [Nitrosopumilaceae archaeon]NIV65302.1 glycosyl transferase [Nitrosopumilaceae archaeon]NIX60803.1 glycosyl transferase [Nitrosopumilaceae archaeon]
MAFQGYNADIYPLDQARGHLDGIGSSSNPEVILKHLQAIRNNLPQEGNPVWIFPTESTSFTRMQQDLETMI